MGQSDRIKILTIDDERVIRTSIRLYLQDFDYEVLEARNGREGLEIFEAEAPDLVLVDLIMPELNGMEVLKVISRISPDTPLIVISGMGAIGDAIEAVREGAWDYILKPIQNMKVLLHALEKALDRQRLLKENKRYQNHLEQLVGSRTEQLRTANAELKTLNERLGEVVQIARQLSACADVDQLGQQLIGHFIRISGAQQGRLYLADGTELTLVHSVGRTPEHHTIQYPIPGYELPGEPGHHAKPLRLLDLTRRTNGFNDPLEKVAAGLDVGTLLLLPLEDENTNVGLVWLYHERPGYFSNQDLEIGALLASYGCEALRTSQAEAEKRILEEQLRRQLEQHNEYLRQEIRSSHAYGELVGTSSVIHSIMEQIESVAPTNAPALILGETGTGKELIARAIHERSRRKDGPFIKVSSGAIPRELFESEFFGHARGAFTGAVKDRDGRFQLADGGTLFLDEVGEIPLELQSKLLRVLQEGTFERVGESRTRSVDVRVISATHRDLKNQDSFREDLYYRLSVFPILVPPLRTRGDDVIQLAEHFIQLACRKFNVPVPRLTPADQDNLRGYAWPGNVRELQNVIDRAVIVANGGPFRFESLELSNEGPAQRLDSNPGSQVRSAGAIPTEQEMKRQKREQIEAALKATGGKVYGPGGAAERLGLKPTTLLSRIKRMGIPRV